MSTDQLHRMPFARSVTAARPFEVKALEALKKHWGNYYTPEDYEKAKISAHWLQPGAPKDVERLTIFFKLRSSHSQESWIEAMMIKSKNGPYEWVGDIEGDREVFIRTGDILRGFNPLESYYTKDGKTVTQLDLFFLGSFRKLDSTMMLSSRKEPLTQNKSDDIGLVAD